MPSLLDDNDMAAALARYNAAEGHSDAPNVKPLRAPRRAKAPAQAKRRKKMTPAEVRDSVMEMYRLQHLRKAEDLPAYDVTSSTRYPAVPLSSRLGDERLKSILKRYQWVMEEQGISPVQLKFWRENIMYMTPAQLGTLVRVNERTIRNWEKGENEIPFSMWWLMHCTLQDPGFFLTRPGFHDFYVDYDRSTGEPVLCSYTYPEIRATPTNLYFNQAALNQVGQLQAKVGTLEKTVDELTAENTRLRQMLKAGTVATELEAMHAHIGTLLKQMHTADILQFEQPVPSVAADELPRSAVA